ncbi:MAG: stage V sporulation protein AC [Clostridiaceae bacterium]|nr:stage V sporulation protein AC [Clostridiales bacterium]MDD6877768.1 stage V sporulation protein AC [Clostridiaceae bacterium]MDY3072116.1 stage V sporulation protein AC [Eubacteriales bacterium]MDY3286254.1 stage V sporulation protein AC [Eubacteriales bacterium]
MIDKKNYQAFADAHAPKSKIWKNLLFAFLIGGAICTVGQGVLSFWKSAGLDTEAAGSATSASMVFLGALFTGLGLYDRLAKYGGAGTLVPITGFANAIVSAALEFKSEGYVLGMSAKMFTIAGPVLVFGISFSVVYGLILRLFGG